MKKLKWLDGYSGQTTNKLIKFYGKYRTDSIVLAFEEALGQKAANIGMEKLTEEERIILTIEALEREVNNGGYEQFFLNTSNGFTPVIVEALSRIGCSKTAAITQNAVDALGIQDSVTVDSANKAIAKEDDERKGKLDQCDNQYYENGENIEESLFEFIKKNKDQITIG